jgi:predicted HicB family RNase H-like nuclease
MSEKQQEIYRIAHELFSQKPDWVTFFREVLGLGGIIRKSYASAEALAEFEKTEEYIQIQHMLAQLRGNNSAPPPETDEPTRVITVRLPKSLHESLRDEAHQHRTSMNKLCISKLLQIINDELIPAEGFETSGSSSGGSSSGSNSSQGANVISGNFERTAIAV